MQNYFIWVETSCLLIFNNNNLIKCTLIKSLVKMKILYFTIDVMYLLNMYFLGIVLGLKILHMNVSKYNYEDKTIFSICC